MNGMNLHLHRDWKTTLLPDWGRSTLSPTAPLLVPRIAWGSPEVLPNSESVGVERLLERHRGPCLITKSARQGSEEAEGIDQQLSHASAGWFILVDWSSRKSGHQAIESCKETIIKMAVNTGIYDM